MNASRRRLVVPGSRGGIRALVCLFAASWALLGSGNGAAPVLSSRVRWAEESILGAMAAGRDPGTLPDFVRMAVRTGGDPRLFGVAGSDPSLDLLALCDDPEALRAAGFRVTTVAGPVVAFDAPLSRLDALERVPGLRWVDLSLPLKPSLDVSRDAINLIPVQGDGEPPYPAAAPTGRGVLLAVIDSGLDLTHPDFRNPDGTTRVMRIWDQTDALGPAPLGHEYGSEWLADDVNAGRSREQDKNGHGTHVAGIAAGNGRAEPEYTYVGVAPEAGLLIVNSVFTERTLIDAVNWVLFNAAGRPCVVNMSLGTQFGPHDGTSIVDQAMNAFSGPGRILVAASGNEADEAYHSELTLYPGMRAATRLSVSEYEPNLGNRNDVLAIEGWYDDDGTEIGVRVTTPGGYEAGPLYSPVREIHNTNDGRVWLEQIRSPLNGDRKIQIDIWDEDAILVPTPGTWLVELHNPSADDTVEVDLWTPVKFLGAPNTDGAAVVGWEDYLDFDEIVSSPASADSVIAVGAYVSKTAWTAVNGDWHYDPLEPIGARASFSSKGPRRDGRMKPDVVAPGMGIISARSATTTNPVLTNPAYVMPDSNYALTQGTSQASPHVAGLAALYLQTHPTASQTQVRNRLIATAFTDSFTGNVPNISYGWGKVDAEAFLGRLLLLTAIWEPGQAVVAWVIPTADPELTFTVERGPQLLGPFTTVSAPIPAGPDTTFRWEDPASEGGWYRVVAARTGAAPDAFGPVHLAPLPTEPLLWQNAPNPFRDATVFAFDLLAVEDVRLEIIDVAGRFVRRLVRGTQLPGHHEVRWDGLDHTGRRVPVGVYMFRLTTPEKVITRRLTRIQ